MDINKSRKKGNEKELINISSDEDIKKCPPRFALPQPTLSVRDLSVPDEKFADFGGIENIPKDFLLIPYKITHPNIFQTLRKKAPGILLFGPPGSGKTFLVKCMAGQYKLPLIYAKDLIRGISSVSEKRIRNLFKEAKANAPCILFLDEVDVIAERRNEALSDMGRQLFVQLITCLDELEPSVLVIGATSRVDSLHPALRRAGRFNKELSLGIPSREHREALVKVIFKGIKLDPEIQFSTIAQLTPGYVAADLKCLADECVTSTFNRVYEEKYLQEENYEFVTFNLEQFNDLFKENEEDSHFVTLEDLHTALNQVQPSSLREGFITIPDVTWDNIGSLGEIRNILSSDILAPIKNPKLFTDMGLTVPIGILLCGPPGCGKTLLAKAIANESGLNFISVRGPELLNMYLGESERAVRQVFERARNYSPCVIFFDELDGLCSRRSNSSNDASARLVSQMITEMDGLNSRKNVFVIAASNRPELIDPAILRPGRLDKILYVDLPSEEDRKDILKTITKTKPPLAPDVNLEEIAKDSRTDGYTGADLAALVREASLYAISEKEELPKLREMHLEKADLATLVREVSHHTISKKEELPKVRQKHLEKALKMIRKSVSEKDKENYEEIKKIYGTNLLKTHSFISSHY